MIVQLTGGNLRMILRSEIGLLTSVSSDNGATWTQAEPLGVSITDEVSRFQYRRLPSGNLLFVYNAYNNGGTAGWGGRYNMTVAISTDEGATWNSKLLLDARGGVSYPDADYDDSGNIYVAYDRGRSSALEILLAQITEADIVAGSVVTGTSYLPKIINNNN
jgi:hypothetical protein